MSWEIKIPRRHLSVKPEVPGKAQVVMYFDVELVDKQGGWQSKGFRLVKKDGHTTLGFPYVQGKGETFYPQFIPNQPLADAILARAEQLYLKETKK